MKRSSLLLLLLVFISSNAYADEWTLWRCDSFKGRLNSPAIPITEHKNLKVCQSAAGQEADATFSWAANNESIVTKTIVRIAEPVGVAYTYKSGLELVSAFRCFPYGIVPVESTCRIK